MVTVQATGVQGARSYKEEDRKWKEENNKKTESQFRKKEDAMLSYLIVAIVSFIAGAIVATLVYRKHKDSGEKIIKTVEDKINNIGV